MDNFNFQTEYYAKIGRKAVRAGLEMANDIIVNVLRDLEDADQAEIIVATPKRGGPRKAVAKAVAALPEPPPKRTTGPGSYWNRMTPEERSAEMRRRIIKKHRNRGNVTDPDAAAAFSAKMSKIAKRAWKKRKADPTLVNGHAAKEITVRQVRQQA